MKGNDALARRLAREAVDELDHEYRLAGRHIMVGPRTRVAMEYATQADLERALTFETLPAARAHVEAALDRMTHERQA